MNAFQESEALANSIAANFFKNHNYRPTTNQFDTADFHITVKGEN